MILSKSISLTIEIIFKVFGFFRKKKPDEIIQDDFFGELSFIEASEYEKSYLFGAKKFSPIGQIIEYQILSKSKIVLDKQKNWAIEIESKYLELVEPLEKFLNEEHERLTTLPSNLDIHKNFDLVLITIPEIFEPNIVWSLEFSMKRDFCFYKIELIDWTPTNLYISA